MSTAFLSKWLDGKTVAVAATSLGAELMAVVFNFYYIKVFLNIYNLDSRWLNISQSLFLVWNAINDPLFGYIQDFGCGNCCKWVTKRRKVILYCGPIYALVFMISWIPWTHGTPSWVVVYMELASLLASFAIFPVDKFSNSLKNFTNFQISCAILAVLSALCFLFTGIKGPKLVAQIEQEKNKENKTENDANGNQQVELWAVSPAEATPGADEEQQKTDSISAGQKVVDEENDGVDARGMGKIIFEHHVVDQSFWESVKEGLQSFKDIVINRDFVAVVSGNFFHILRTIGDANFLAIFTEALVSPNYEILARGTTALSLFYTGCNAVPKIFLALCWPLLQKFGAWSVTTLTVLLTLFNCLVIFFVGRHNYSALAIFFLIEFILSRSLWPAVYNIFFPDIIDEDMKRHSRKFEHVWPQKLEKNAENSTYIDLLPTSMPETDLEKLLDNMFLVACFYPLACSVLETLCLLPYRLKFRHKRDKKKQ